MFGLFLALSFFVIVIGVIHQSTKNKQNKQSLLEELHALTKSGINISKYSQVSPLLLIGLSRPSKKFIILRMHGDNVRKTIIDFENIHDCELIKDGTIVYRKSAARAIGGALIGGAISGGVGAIIGGLSGSSKAEEIVNKIELKILTKDMNGNAIWITFYDSKKDVKNILKDMLREAENWKDTVSLIIDMNS